MSNVIDLPSAAMSPADVLDTLRPDADRVRAVVVVALMDDGSWHVRHSTAQASVIDSAAVNLLRFAQDK